ncbi:MAG: hypothetical protein QOE89_2788 [Pseudonocardiales bacterium]|nr:hypothetical protein [Pseudonocardiales bacterium]
MTSMRLSTFLLLISVMLTIGGIAYGVTPVSVAADSSCGNAFSKSGTDLFTGTGDDACATARSDRQSLTWALMAAGIAGMVMAGIAVATEFNRVTTAAALVTD